jgi:hypothetical protein
MSSPFITVGELSGILRKSEKWCYQQLRNGQIPGSFKLGGSWLIDRTLLIDTLNKFASKPKPQSQVVTDPQRDRHNLV